MKLVRPFLFAAALLALASTASATTIWNLDNVVFNRPGFGTNTVTGSFTMNTAATAITAWDITVAGGNIAANHHYFLGGAGEGVTFYSATQIAFNDTGFAHFLNLAFASPLTNSGGTISLLGGNGPSSSSSYACPGCGTLVSGGVTTNSVGAVATPEPATWTLLLLGGAVAARQIRRRARG